jgi:DNA repair photolyase
MEIIYEPKGKAKEYASLAVNLYEGCEHGCTYCFGPATLKREREKFHASSHPKNDALQRLSRDAEKLRIAGDDREILLSFVTDPYQTIESETKLTQEAIKILRQNDLRFTILTKGGLRAVRDFDLLAGYDKASFGSTLIFTNQADADRWEPNAPKVDFRIEAIKEAKKRGIRTWVSLEPVICPDQALELIEKLHPFVNHWKVGKLNYRRLSVDWLKFRNNVTGLLDALKADYYLKRSFRDIDQPKEKRKRITVVKARQVKITPSKRVGLNAREKDAVEKTAKADEAASSSLVRPVQSSKDVVALEKQKKQLVPASRLEAQIRASNDIGELKDIQAKAEALRGYLQSVGESLNVQNQAAEVKIRAERRCGEILASEIKQGGDRKSESKFNRRTLKDFGIKKNQSRCWQAVAQLPEDLFEEHLAKIREAKKELTSACVYRKAFEFRRAKEADKAPILGADSTKTPIRIRTISGDFMDHIGSFKNVDAIITDPPYLKEHIHIYENLARFAAQVLKPGGSLLAMAGVQHLPEVLALMTPHLTYHWAISYYMPGKLLRVWQRKVMCAWKPVLWFVKGLYKGKWVADVCRSDAPEKEHHLWQQSESGIAELVEKFTQPGEMIIDPLFGSGTLGEVAIKLNRQFLGIEIDSKTLETAEKRLDRVAKKIVLPSYFPNENPSDILDNWEKNKGGNGDADEMKVNPANRPDEQEAIPAEPFEENGKEYIPTDQPGRYIVNLYEPKPDQSNEAGASDTGSGSEGLPN